MKKLGQNDEIVTAFAESASGPGWANQPVWCVVRSRLNGVMTMMCLQPEEQSAEVMSLYGVSQAAHTAMVHAVKGILKK